MSLFQDCDKAQMEIIETIWIKEHHTSLFFQSPSSFSISYSNIQETSVQ